ncbi:hypothetical protein [Gordonia alkanivorans]|uniref:hypothetical protein n=1 Tax=Gordonia alkanivorans TaxID=84096 RepID=UPI002447D4BD|nr:hypothetical protein [Gordonia alkanivorans]MDH3021149.1 hypothetical protein [Gordonia alkanivorans]MDJ0010393.1 hypothetical protein [Gordonia alkanivorans]MDJ0099909.1 hypothetical protein [Gordonia alkanivorans]MDJ0496029.1 hypothetical protein [Gordonia alkanivorans]
MINRTIFPAQSRHLVIPAFPVGPQHSRLVPGTLHFRINHLALQRNYVLLQCIPLFACLIPFDPVPLLPVSLPLPLVSIPVLVSPPVIIGTTTIVSIRLRISIIHTGSALCSVTINHACACVLCRIMLCISHF